MHKHVLAHLVGSTLACSICSAQTQSFFMGLGDLPGGNVSSQALGISADGTTVVGSSRSVNGNEAFRWTLATGMVGLGDLPGGNVGSGANGVSADGTIVVGSSDSVNGQESFRWTAKTGMTGLGVFPGGTGSRANAVSADGSVIVGLAWMPGWGQGYRWTPATGFVGLGHLPGASSLFSHATGVSLDGMVVAMSSYSACSGDAYEPARWTPGGGMQGLGGIPGQPRCYGFAFGVSPDGSAIAGWTKPLGEGVHAFRWTAQTGMVSLGALPSRAARGAGALSENGDVVVGAWFTVEDPAYIWDAALGLRSLKSALEIEYGLDLTGWTLTEPRGISADGRTIVGWGTNPQGNAEGWIAHLGDACYADCDQSGVLNIFDFLCFQNSFVGGDPYACECDPDPACNIFDFLCFQTAFVGGCP